MIRSNRVAIVAAVLGVSMGLAAPADAGGWGHHHHDGGGDVALGVGLGIIGLGVTAALLSQPPAYYAPPPPPVYYAPQPPPVYYAPPPPVVVVPPQPLGYGEPSMMADPTSDSYLADDGRECREYQTNVVVGGRTRRAYGTACLEPDGTWRVVR